MAVTETKSLRTSYLQCGPDHGSTIVSAPAIYVTSFTCRKSTLCTNKHLVTYDDISTQGLESLCLSRKKQEEMCFIKAPFFMLEMGDAPENINSL